MGGVFEIPQKLTLCISSLILATLILVSMASSMISRSFVVCWNWDNSGAIITRVFLFFSASDFVFSQTSYTRFKREIKIRKDNEFQ